MTVELSPAGAGREQETRCSSCRTGTWNYFCRCNECIAEQREAAEVAAGWDRPEASA